MSPSGGRPRVLFYAHHHGSGHVRHAAALVGTGAFEVTVATAHPDAARLLPPGTPMVALPSDEVEGFVQPTGSSFHHTPTGTRIVDRFGTLLDAARVARADVAVVDVSVEAALFLRLAGLPVLHVRMHGDRTDPAHDLLHREVDGLVAHHLPALEDPGWLSGFGHRTTFVGVPDDTGRLGIRATPSSPSTRPRVAVVAGTGGGGLDADDLARASAQVPWADWEVLGPVRGGASALPAHVRLHGWVDDVSARLGQADVVVASAGQNATVDAVRSGRPVVLAPEDRPFDEQHHVARAAHRAGGVPWAAWADAAADWDAAVRAALADPASADRLSEALLVSPDEHLRRWQDAVARATAR